MAAAPLDLGACTASFDLQPHPDCPRRLFYATGVATHPALGEVATLRGYVLRPRYAWKKAGDFVEVMDDESDELMHFSTEVFDNDTNVLPWLIDGGRRSGSGCWGQELNRGDIVYLEDLTVTPTFVRRGVGSWFLQKFLNAPEVDFNVPGFPPPHVFCWPATGPRSDSLTNDDVVSFFRKNHFRRIGRTNFLCYSYDPGHPSRTLAVADDPNPLSNDFVEPASAEELQAQCPLHTEIANNKTPEIVNVIKEAYAADPSSIHKVAPDGRTPIHVAAGTQNLPAIRTLIDLGVADDLQNATNKMDKTPLEALDTAMRFNREFLEKVLGLWDGYSVDDLTCEYLLKKASGMTVLPESEEDYVVKRKFGCSCGQCTEGWLSQRMRFRLAVTAIVDSDTTGIEIDYLTGRHPAAYYVEQLNLDYLPPAVQAHADKNFCRSWAAGLRAVQQVLKTPDAIPTPRQVATHPLAFDYTLKGGKVEYLLDSITDMAKDQSPLGDGTFEDTHESYHDLPACDNDLAFALVRRKLGLDPREQWGPYRDYGDVDEEMDDDSDDY